MSWLTAMTTAGTDSCNNGYNNFQSTADSSDTYILQWVGLANSPFDGYEVAAGQPETVQQFTVDTRQWPNRIEWGNQHKGWIRVTVGADNQTTAGTDLKQFNFYYRWTGVYPQGWPQYEHIDFFTGEFAPIPEDKEVAPETFLKWLEKIGHDDSFLRVSYKMQKKMMKEVGHLPPWDPRKIEEIEKGRQRFHEYCQGLLAEDKRSMEEKLMERWGIREIPPITPELLTEIEARSMEFLKECLSPAELEFFDEHGHLKIKSRRNSNIYYIVERKPHGKIERWINGEHEENVCYQSKWGSLPLNDTIAMKVLDIKWNEEEFLKVGNITRIRRH